MAIIVRFVGINRMLGAQDDITIVVALYVFARATRNDIISEHAMHLADDIAREQGLRDTEDAVAQSTYIRC